MTVHLPPDSVSRTSKASPRRHLSEEASDEAEGGAMATFEAAVVVGATRMTAICPDASALRLLHVGSAMDHAMDHVMSESRNGEKRAVLNAARRIEPRTGQSARENWTDLAEIYLHKDQSRDQATTMLTAALLHTNRLRRRSSIQIGWHC